MIHTQDADFTLLNSDVIDGLRSLPDGSVHCVVTSPPYWGLRDYGTGEWEGGDPDCDHAGTVLRTAPAGSSKQASNTGANAAAPGDCACGARRNDQQLGLEPTPDLYVQRMVEVFREVRRVLRDDGTCWLNLGDSYAAQGGGKEAGVYEGKRVSEADWQPPRSAPAGLKPKDLVGIPWRVAFALQADGWYLRSDIIWSKPNPMPEPVTDRPTKAHEYVFLLSKGPRYFFDQEAVREPVSPHSEFGRNSREQKGTPTPYGLANGKSFGLGGGSRGDPSGRNVRSVWEIATQPYPEAHFATYPEELVRRCVLAGTSERGCCPVCGKPWEREVEVPQEGKPDPNAAKAHGGIGNNLGGGRHQAWRNAHPAQTIGWRPGCGCALPGHNRMDKRLVASLGADIGAHALPPIPCTVLDPFLGSGTTAYVARKHGRRSIGIELNPEYCELAARRMQQQSLFA